MIRIGLPKGSLEKKTIELLAGAGLLLERLDDRCFLVDFKSNGFLRQGLILRPQMMPEAVASGMVDCGFCGLDCLLESGLEAELNVIAQFPYAKRSDHPACVTAFVKEKDLSVILENGVNGFKVISEYPNMAKKEFPNSRISFSYGGTEQMVAYGDYDIGIGIVETGDSLRANGLVILKRIRESPVVLLGRKQAKAEIINSLAKVLGINREK